MSSTPPAPRPTSQTFGRYVSSMYRQLQIRLSNAQISSSSNRSSLLCLPDDILIMITDILYSASREPPWRGLEKLRQQNLAAFINLSMANKRLRAISSAKLHKVIHLGPSWSTERMQDTLEMVIQSPYAMGNVQDLQIDLWQAPSAQRPETKHFARDIFELLPYFRRLRKLTITGSEASAAALQVASTFADTDRKRLFKDITQLTLSPYMSWFIDHCPSLESLSTNDWILMSYTPISHEIDLIKKAGEAQHLTDLAIHCRWHKSIIKAVLEYLPNIRHLALPGGTTLAELLPSLQKLPHLEKLGLVDASRLMNATGMFPALERARSETPRSRPGSSMLQYNQEVAVRCVFTSLPRLKQLTLGKTFTATAIDSEHGTPTGEDDNHPKGDFIQAKYWREAKVFRGETARSMRETEYGPIEVGKLMDPFNPYRDPNVFVCGLPMMTSRS